MKTPLISIILTTYNRCHLLPRAINSILDGGYSNFELIIVDDASSDNTTEIVSKYNDDRIQYIKMPENCGVLCARNRGFDQVSGDFITILDDDDELVLNALSTVASEFVKAEREGIDILWFDCQDVEAGQISGSMPNSGGIIKFEDYLCGRIQGDFWMVFNKAALYGQRFNEELKAHESLLWLRIHQHHKAGYISKVLCKKYREHGGKRLCDLDVRLGQLRHTTLALSQFIKEFGDQLLQVSPSVYGNRLAYLGLHQMSVNDFVSGRLSIIRSLKFRYSTKYAIFYLLSFFINQKHVINIIKRMES